MTSTVAIINWNGGLLLRTCVESLLATTANVGILVIDNASEDTSLESVQGFRNRVNIVRNSANRGFAAAVNQAFHTTSTSYILILNPDIRVMPGSVKRLEQFLDVHERAAAIGGYVGEKYLPRKFPTVGALVLQNLGASPVSDIRRQSEPVLVDQPAAAALMVRRAAFDEVGGFDEQFFPAWYEDVDFCRRIKAKGWDIYFDPDAEFMHEGGYSAGALGSVDFARAFYRNQLRYARKHFGPIGAAAVRTSIAAGMIGRMIGRPKYVATYGKVFLGVLKGW